MARETVIVEASRRTLWCLGIATAVCLFWTYGSSRVWLTDGAFGFTAQRGAMALVLAVLLIPLLPLVAGPLGLLFYFVAVLGIVLRVWPTWPPGVELGERFCAGCGYPAEGLVTGKCPECAGERFDTKGGKVEFRRRWGPILLALAAGGAAGVCASEAWLSLDEARFRREVAAVGGADVSRARAWPFGDSLLHSFSGVLTSHGD